MTTPADIANALAKRKFGSRYPELLVSMTKNHAHLEILAKSIGIDVAESLDSWVTSEGLDEVRTWLASDARDSNIASSWMSQVRDVSNPLATLVREQQLSNRGAGIGAYLRSAGTGYAHALGRARIEAAEALLGHANGVPFHKPVTLMRASEVAREYLEVAVEVSKRAMPDKTDDLKRSLGRLVVLSARFGGQDARNIERAREHLRDRTAQEEDVPAAVSFLEASIQLYHLSGNKKYLIEAVKFARERSVPPVTWGVWYLNLAEIWIHLAGLAASNEARQNFADYSNEALTESERGELDIVFEVRQKLLRALLEFFRINPNKLTNVSMVGLELPFGLRAAGRQMPPIFYDASKELMSALYARANRGQYSYRDFLAEILSHVARHENNENRVRHLLSEAIRLREPVGTKEKLKGMRSTVALGQDLLYFAELTGSAEARRRGVDVLSARAARKPNESESLVLLALDLEKHGPIAGFGVHLPTDLRNALVSGNARFFFEKAARIAMLSPELRQRGLGGRGGVATVEDYSGLTGQTFVFKEMSDEGRMRDEARGESLKVLIADNNLAEHFGVIDHLTAEQSADKVVSVRRFIDGQTLRTLLHNSGDSWNSMERTVDFLAFIHAKEVPSAVERVRRELKSKELGRWLRYLLGEKAGESFAQWWDAMSTLPSLARRDAHSLNWLVDSSGRVLAVDLESKGARPAMYELAQLIEDWPVLTPEDLDSRRRIVRRYLRALHEHGGPKLPWGIAWEAYGLSMAARAVGLLTDPQGVESARLHAHKLLRRLTQDDLSIRVKDWSSEVSAAWSVKAGLADPSRYSSITEAERVRISRAMSYHLRHDRNAPTTRGGWIYAADLAGILAKNGHDVTPEQLLVVAGALGEPRFELDRDEIRAAYGHSLDHKVAYEATRRSAPLYHGAPYSGMASIFEARAGLSSMQRQMVHMTDEVAIARHAARRRREAVFVLVIEASKVDGLVNAAARTWLAPNVPVDSLRVLPVHEALLVEQSRFSLHE